MEIWAKLIVAKGFKNCPKSNKSPNLDTLSDIHSTILLQLFDVSKMISSKMLFTSASDVPVLLLVTVLFPLDMLQNLIIFTANCTQRVVQWSYLADVLFTNPCCDVSIGYNVMRHKLNKLFNFGFQIAIRSGN